MPCFCNPTQQLLFTSSCCGYYWRMATNREQGLLNWMWSFIETKKCQLKSLMSEWCRWTMITPLPRQNFTLSLLSCCFATKWYIHGFPIHFLTFFFQWLHKLLSCWSLSWLMQNFVTNSLFSALHTRSKMILSQSCSCATETVAKQVQCLFYSALPQLRLLLKGRPLKTMVVYDCKEILTSFYNLWILSQSAYALHSSL